MPDVALNIQEFNTIAGLIFAQLYKAFPAVEKIDQEGIAKAMGVGDNWSKHRLPSGRSFGDMLAYTIVWLKAEEYIKPFGAPTSTNVLLATKGLIATNNVPTGLTASVGTELRKVVEHGSASTFDLSRIGDLIGGVFGGFTKSVSSG